MELDLQAYAQQAGISIFTARRRVKQGKVPSELRNGKYYVTVPDEEMPSAEPVQAPSQLGERTSEVARLRGELVDAREMVAEIKKQRDHLLTEVEDRRQAESELRQLLAQSQINLQRLLPGPVEEEKPVEEPPEEPVIEAEPKRRWWFWRK